MKKVMDIVSHHLLEFGNYNMSNVKFVTCSQIRFLKFCLFMNTAELAISYLSVRRSLPSEHRPTFPIRAKLEQSWDGGEKSRQVTTNIRTYGNFTKYFQRFFWVKRVLKWEPSNETEFSASCYCTSFKS